MQEQNPPSPWYGIALMVVGAAIVIVSFAGFFRGGDRLTGLIVCAGLGTLCLVVGLSLCITQWMLHRR